VDLQAAAALLAGVDLRVDAELVESAVARFAAAVVDFTVAAAGSTVEVAGSTVGVADMVVVDTGKFHPAA